MRNKTFVTAVFASFAWNLYLVGGVMLGASYALDRAAGGHWNIRKLQPIGYVRKQIKYATFT